MCREPAVAGRVYVDLNGLAVGEAQDVPRQIDDLERHVLKNVTPPQVNMKRGSAVN
jgi:hypothetical protein